MSSPSLTSSRATVPSSKASIGITALSVWISASVSPSLTWSPTLTSHLTICPLSIVGLSLAIFTSIGTGNLQRPVRERPVATPPLAVEHVVDLGHDPVDARQHR